MDYKKSEHFDSITAQQRRRKTSNMSMEMAGLLCSYYGAISSYVFISVIGGSQYL